MPAGSARLGGDVGAGGPGRLLRRLHGGVGGQDAAARLGRAEAGRDLPRWLLPSGRSAWGRWV